MSKTKRSNSFDRSLYRSMYVRRMSEPLLAEPFHVISRAQTKPTTKEQESLQKQLPSQDAEKSKQGRRTHIEQVSPHLPSDAFAAPPRPTPGGWHGEGRNGTRRLKTRGPSFTPPLPSHLAIFIRMSLTRFWTSFSFLPGLAGKTLRRFPSLKHRSLTTRDGATKRRLPR